jgi:hypothetical protein
MMPMPAALLERVTALAARGRGLRAVCASVEATPWDYTAAGIAYLDPPYAGLTAYGDAFEVEAFARTSPFPLWVSEGRAISPGAVMLAATRRKGGISGDRAVGHAEWLSPFNL